MGANVADSVVRAIEIEDERFVVVHIDETPLAGRQLRSGADID